MAQPLGIYTFLLSLLILISTGIQAEHPVLRRQSRARAFIKLQCHTTLYPDVCIRCLSYYVANLTTLSRQQLAQFALKVSLEQAESTRAYVTGVVRELRWAEPRDREAMEECLNQINDGVDQLANCMKETRKIKEDGEFPWHASNVETWMSTALTDASACLDGFSGRALRQMTKAMIKARVVNLQHVMSNALALFNTYAERYRTSASFHYTKPKAP